MASRRNFMGPASLSRMLVVGSLCVTALAIATSAQKMDARVIDRRADETTYIYHVPAHPSATPTAPTDCNTISSSSSSSGNCSTSAPSTTDDPTSASPSYRVTGTTLALLLPGGRIAVVNCVSKNMLKIDPINRRSCRMPNTDAIQANFSGRSVKLKWQSRLDARKLRSETYRLVAFVPKP
jgi:hypothetical protein